MPRWLKRFRADNDRLRAAREREVVTELTLNLLTLLQAGCVAGLLVLSALFVGYGRLSVGVAVVFVLATRDILGRFEDLAASLGEARSAHVRLARLLDLVRATAPPRQVGWPHGVDPVGLPARGRLVLTGVGFTYGPGAPVVDGLSLTVAPGERLVVVGPTGAGKSTVGKLLAGLYPPDRGTVTYGGHELTALTARSLRSRIVLVPQEVTLVAGTLGENLAMVAGRPGPDRVAAVLDTLGLSGWVASLPGGSVPRWRRTRCRPGSGSWSRSRGRCWPIRRCWCWTRRPPGWTGRRPRGSRTRCRRRPGTGRWW